jgi:serine/threonine protein kinase
MDTRAPTHPSANKLRGFGLGQLEDADAVAVMSHLDSCTQCQKEVAAVTGDYFLDRLREARSRSGTPLPGKSLSELARSLYATIPPPALGPTVSDLPSELANHPQYEVVSELGRGGMGVVYLARHRLSGRHEVLKVMNRELLARSGSKERFLREIQSAAMLDHPNVVKMYTAMEMGDLMVLVMEYVKGEDLAKLVKAKGRLPVPNACFYAHQVALGLQHAFEKGMVHRDIKPQNVILAKEGKKHLVKVLDFGLAKVVRERGEQFELTGQGQMLGTPDYIAPEQTLDATNADIRADIYSLGCSLYFLLSGRAPFKGKSLFEILQAHQSQEAPLLSLERPEISAELAAIMAKMMAKDPTKRFQQPIQAAQALAPFFRADARPRPPQDVVLEKPAPPTQENKSTIVPLAEIVNESKDKPKSNQSVSGSPWELLRDSDVALNEVPKAKKNPKRTIKPQLAKNKKMLIAAGVLVGILFTTLVGLWAAGVFKVKTKEGTLIVEVNEPNAEVYVDGEKVTVSWDDSGKKTEIRVKPGTHQIELKKDGFTAEGQRVSLTEGGHEIVSARLERMASAKPSYEPGRKDSAVLDVGKPGIAELESLRADLVKLVYARNPERLKTRTHALEELDAARKAMAAGKTKTEVQEHLDKIQKDIEALTGVAQNPENRIQLLDAEKHLIGAIKYLNTDYKEVPSWSAGIKEGFVPLFNGKDLTGWKTHDTQPGNWRVEKGILIGSGPVVSHLYSAHDDYKDFHLLVEARINDGGNSGVYFRSSFGPGLPEKSPQWPLGYEAQINSTHRDPRKTGSLYAGTDGAVVSLKESPVPAGEWFSEEVIALGNHIVIKVNGRTTADYTDEKRRFTSGHLALQQFTPETVAEFRKIEIKELPSAKVEAGPLKPDPAAEQVTEEQLRQRIEAAWPGLGNRLSKDSAGNYSLHLRGCEQVTDLKPLKGMPLTTLNITYNGVIEDLTPLQGMNLKSLWIGRCPRIRDLRPLQGMELDFLDLAQCNGLDLSQLHGMKIKFLSLWNRCDNTRLRLLRGIELNGLNVNACAIDDLTPLKGMAITELKIADNKGLSDLRPLRDLPLQKLNIKGCTKIVDITPLKDLPLKEITCDFKPERDAAILRGIKTLEKINDKEAMQFWKDAEAAGLVPPLNAALPPPGKSPIQRDKGFVSLFNGKELSGWKLPTGGTGAWKAQNGMIVSSGRPATSSVSAMITTTSTCAPRFKSIMAAIAACTSAPRSALDFPRDTKPKSTRPTKIPKRQAAYMELARFWTSFTSRMSGSLST